MGGEWRKACSYTSPGELLRVCLRCSCINMKWNAFHCVENTAEQLGL